MADFLNVFARVEKKYFVSEEQHAALTMALRMRGFSVQSYGSPTIQSIYYDTPDYELIRRSIDRPDYKEKLRLRTYGQPTDASMGYAEVKKKYAGVVYKRRTGLPLSQAMQALNGGWMPQSSGQIGREINWFLQTWSVEPKLIIAYEREAWVDSQKDGVRITFDQSIRFRSHDLDMTLPPEGTLLIPDGLRLMEIKIPGAWPLWLTRLLQTLNICQIHFSKYGEAYKRYLAPGRTPAPKTDITEVAYIA